MSYKNVYTTSMPIGEIILNSSYPVFFDPHTPIAHNKPPVTLITGAPGSGKTMCGLLMAAHASICGKDGYILDPKGDFSVLKLLENDGDINSVNVWSLLSFNGEGDTDVDIRNVGILDPTCIYPRKEDNVTLCIDIIQALIGKEISSKQSNYLTPIIKDACAAESPSLSLVIQMLRSSRDEDIRALGTSLDSITSTSLSKLLIRNKKIEKRVISQTRGITVFNLMGITLPMAGTSPKDYTIPERVSMAIISILTQLILTIMMEMPKTEQKILIADEAWTLMSNATTAAMIDKVSLLGRSLNTAIILLTQSPKHVNNKVGADMSTTISSRLAFNDSDISNNKITTDAMNLPEEDNWGAQIGQLESGQCLMQDFMGQVGVVGINIPDKWFSTFDTNPLEAIRRQEAEEAQKLAEQRAEDDTSFI